MKTLSIQLAALLVAFAATAEAQNQATPAMAGVQGVTRHNVHPYHPVTPGYRMPNPYYNPWPTYHHASTAAEGYARGKAAITRAQGQYNLLTAEANVVNQEAYRRGIENQTRKVNGYFALREKNREERAVQRGPRASAEQLRRIAAAGKPATLSPSELDSATGGIAWPTLLEREEYEPFRADLEEAFARRADNGRMEPADLEQAEQAAEGMIAELKSHVREIPSHQYIAARRFVESLAYDAQQPAG
ncbi:MAG: hypothetical protein HQ582_15565 [Planctomycetes bacterium]|nr:hypothetical protein [Planctomycetota bacterium]